MALFCVDGALILGSHKMDEAATNRGEAMGINSPQMGDFVSEQGVFMNQNGSFRELLDRHSMGSMANNIVMKVTSEPEEEPGKTQL